MTNQELTNPELVLIDQKVDELIAAWSAYENGEERSPSLRDFLGATTGRLRAELLSFLLQTDVEQRALRQIPLNRTEYESELPNDVGLLRSLLNDTGAMKGSPTPKEPELGSGEPALVIESNNQIRIAGYQIEECVGQGGMGAVYKAQDQHFDPPRTVAIKVVRSGAVPSPKELNRLRDEASMLSGCSHPHIVVCHDVVSGEDGSLGLILEYVAGGTLQKWKADNPCSPTEAIHLVQKLTSAINHVHRRGIIHRDLKPANVLMTSDGEPKITDFGIAQKEGRQTGTPTTVEASPLYAPPEQLTPKALVDVRSDVYGLGGILYFLFTGKAPNVPTTTPSTPDEESPATEVSSPRTHNPKLNRDLELICLKCLKSSPDDRYQSVEMLENDIHNYLEVRETMARPRGRRGRLWLWVRRQPALASILVLLLLILAAGIVVPWQINLRLAAKNREISETLTREQQNFNQAQLTLNDLFEVGTHRLAKYPGVSPLRRDILEKCLDHYRWFIRNRKTNQRFRYQVVEAYLKAGAIHRELGNSEEAERSYSTALSRLRELNAASPESVTYQTATGVAHHQLGLIFDDVGNCDRALLELKEAVKVHQKVWDTTKEAEQGKRLAGSWGHLALIHERRGDFVLAKKHFALSLEIQSQAVEKGKTAKLREVFAALQHNYADFLEEQGRSQEAFTVLSNVRRTYEELLKGREKDRELQHHLCQTYFELAKWFQKTGKSQEARKLFLEAMRIEAKLSQENPFVIDYSTLLGKIYVGYGQLLSAEGQYAEARQYRDRGANLFLKIIDRHPRHVEYQTNVASSLNDLALLQLKSGQVETGMKTLQLAQTRFQKVLKKHPKNPVYKLMQAQYLYNLSLAHRLLSDHPSALVANRRSRDLLTEIKAHYEGVTAYTRQSAIVHNHLGILYMLQGKSEDAINSYLAAEKEWKVLRQTNPEVIEWNVGAGGTSCNVGILKQKTDGPESALRWFNQAIEILSKTRQQAPGDAYANEFLHHSYVGKTESLLRLGQVEEATRTEKLAIEIEKEYSKLKSSGEMLVVSRCGSYCDFGGELRQSGKAEKSLLWYDKAVATLKPLVDGNPKNLTARRFLRNSYWGKVDSLTQLNRYEDALRTLQMILELKDPNLHNYFRAYRVHLLARTGQYKQAIKESAGLDQVKVYKGDVFYRLAATWSLSAGAVQMDSEIPPPMRQKLAETYALNAISFLERAAATGYFRVKGEGEKLEKDVDLAPLRKREDFQQFLKKLKSQKSKGRLTNRPTESEQQIRSKKELVAGVL